MSMRMIRINGTELDVSAVCLCEAFIGLEHCPEETACRLLDMYLDLGGNFLDTGRLYSNWVPGEEHRSERIIGDYLRRTGKRDRVVLCSKGCHYDLQTHASTVSPRRLQEEIDGSLQTLRTDCIELYLLHRDDESVPVGELLEVFEAARRAGKIKHYGSANWSVARLKEADAYAAEHKLDGFRVNQITMHPGVGRMPRPSDTTLTLWNQEYADYHHATGMTVMACSSMANGAFALYGTAGFATLFPGSLESHAFVAEAERIKSVAAQTGRTPSQQCLRYTADYPGVQAIPLFSVSSEEHMREAMKCFDK